MKENAKTKRSKVRAVIISVISVIVLLMSLMVFISVVASRASGKVPSVLGFSFHVVVTQSMEPEIKVGDLVLAKRTNKSKIKKGDDIIFENPDKAGMYIVHRVVDVYEDGSIKTWGINNTENGKPVYDEFVVNQIEGKAIAVSTFWGKVFGIFQDSRSIIFILVLMVFGIMVVYEILNISKISADKKRRAALEAEVKEELLKEIAEGKHIKDMKKGSTDGDNNSEV